MGAFSGATAGASAAPTYSNGQLSAGAMGAGVGGIASGLFGLLFPSPNPADDANKTLGKIPGEISPYYSPYINQGLKANGMLNNQYSQMMSDPNAIINRLGSGYQQSPGFQWNLNQGQQAINNANASGGMLGTPQHQQQAGQMASGLASQDYNNYMQQVLGMYNNGMSGMSHIGDQGFQASGSMADTISNMLASQAQYGYAGQAAENDAQSQNMSNLFSGLGSLATMAALA